MRRVIVAGLVVLGSLALTGIGWAEDAGIRGTIDAVTVYRGQALVTRLVEVPGPAGLKEVVVTDLPEQVLPGSIYAESADGVEVRSVSYRVRPVEKDVREEVRKLDEQIRAVQDQMAANQRHCQLAGERKEYLAKLEQFTAPTANVEFTKGVLNAETVDKITKFQFTQRQQIADEELKLAIERRELGDQLQTLQEKRGQIATSSAKLAREAVVFVSLGGNGGKLRVRYLVNSASWAPSYNIRASSGKDGVTVEYLASVQQMSGEDWGNVAMTLSTAMPSLVAKAPTLTELNIALLLPGRGRSDEFVNKLMQKDYKTMKQELSASQYGALGNRNFSYNGGTLNYENAANAPQGQTTISGGVVQQREVQNFVQQPQGNNTYTGATQIDNDVDVNAAAAQQQLLDVLTQEKITRSKEGKGGRETDVQEGLSITYSLANRTSLPSRSDRQLIQIASLPLKAEAYKVASPVLTSYVYNEAQVTNSSQTVLLAGPVATYVDSQFVGQGFVPTVAVGENFTVGLGIDSSLRASRELVEKTEATQGGNRVIDFTYRLAIDNFGSAAAKVRLLDRIPVPKEGELKVTPGLMGRELSKDAAYEQTEKKKGILRWDVEVPAQALGTKVFAFEYHFGLEYDKQMAISGLPARK